jgi:hypothetical protein
MILNAILIIKSIFTQQYMIALAGGLFYLYLTHIIESEYKLIEEEL